MAEAERLARSGVREITLIGQDTTCYGEEFGLKDGLALLLERLTRIQDLRWIRFLYAYPNKITGRLLETIAAHEKICAYIDVPLQHASASVLKRMKRGGGADVFLRSIETMRRVIPGVTLRTSFIVGFPGETTKEFEELCEFVRQAEFDWMGTFGYSDQDGAAAFGLDKKVPPREIERRRKHLMQIQRRISKKKKKALVGQEFDLLLEGWSEESDLLLEGRTAMHAPEIDGKVFVNDIPGGNRSADRVSSTAARSPKRTTMIWSQRLWDDRLCILSCQPCVDLARTILLAIYGPQAHREAEVPDLQEAGEK